MAIYYHSDFSEKHGQLNFGDDINPFILRRFLPKELIASKNVCIVGIGTLLNNGLLKEIDEYDKALVFCSGVGYGKHGELIGNPKLVYAGVRGPKSSNALNLKEEIAKTDAAILLYEKKTKCTKRHRVTFIPHINTDWSSGNVMRRTCEELDINYMAPNSQLDEFIENINASDLVITEAMHGAIVADTLRVPWIPIKIHNALEFKWQDWTGSMKLEYAPYDLAPIYNASNSLVSKTKTEIKHFVFKRQLKRLLATPPILSDESVFERKLEEVLKLTDPNFIKNLI